MADDGRSVLQHGDVRSCWAVFICIVSLLIGRARKRSSQGDEERGQFPEFCTSRDQLRSDELITAKPAAARVLRWPQK